MKIARKKASGVRASQIAYKSCARCGTAIEGNEICAECQGFFWELSGRKVESTTNIRRRMQRRLSIVVGK